MDASLLALAEPTLEMAGAGELPPVQLIVATRLQVLALSLANRGRVLSDGSRLSHRVMQALIHDAITEGRRDQLTPSASPYAGAVLTGIVARDNLASLTLCERHGLRSQVAYDARHVRVSGYFKSARASWRARRGVRHHRRPDVSRAGTLRGRWPRRRLGVAPQSLS